MKITGYMLREAIKQHTLRSEAAASLFPTTIKTFEGEEKEAPYHVAEIFLDAERALAKLRTYQARYNLTVVVATPGGTMTLAEAIKHLVAESKFEKLWRELATQKRDRYDLFHEAHERDPSRIQAILRISLQRCTELAQQAGKTVGQYRQAIATGNAKEVELDQDLDPALFE